MSAQALDGIDWSWLALDSAVTKVPLEGGRKGPSPTDSGKWQVAGAWHLAGRGGRWDHPARHEAEAGGSAADSTKGPRPTPTPDKPQGLCLDRGNDYEEVRERVVGFLGGMDFTAHLRSRGEEKCDIQKPGFRARRWVVERTHGWMNRCRGLLMRWTKKAENCLAFILLACGGMTGRAPGLLGYALCV